MYIESMQVKGDKDQSYTITIKNDEATCSCLAFVFNPGTPCKHMRFVLTQVAVSGQ